jgi:hypothetical protein
VHDNRRKARTVTKIETTSAVKMKIVKCKRNIKKRRGLLKERTIEARNTMEVRLGEFTVMNCET